MNDNNENAIDNAIDKNLFINHPLNIKLISDFYSFPFLRDQLFLSFFRALKFDAQCSLESFILNSQITYFTKFINSQFDPKIIPLSSSSAVPLKKVSKCPFASKSSGSTPSPSQPFVVESLSRVRYSVIENIHISDMDVSGLTVNIVRPDSSDSYCSDADFNVFTSGTHFQVDFDFNSRRHFILFSDSKFINPKLISHPIINEIFKTKPVLSSSDLFFLFPENVHIINPSDLDRLLNIIIYLNILKLNYTLETIKRLLFCWVEPSSIEPYNDLLSVEYIQSNPDLFK